MPTIQRISPCLWFDTKGEDAAKFYVDWWHGYAT